MRFFALGPEAAPRSICWVLLFYVLVAVAGAANTNVNAKSDGKTTTTTDSATTTSTTQDTTTTTDANKSTDSSTSTTTSDPTSTTTTSSSSLSLPPLTTSTSSSLSLPPLPTSSSLSLPPLPSSALAITNIPVITVPPTADAPYMQSSKLPEGTVFIAVGGGLGLVGLTVLAWRALVAWSVNRSVRRAAMLRSDTKRLLRPNGKQPSATVYRYDASSTNLSLDKLSSNRRHSHRASKVRSTQSGLFFSPTAGPGMHNAGNRGSSYLPAGYYAAGTAAGGGNHGSSSAALVSPPPPPMPFSPSTSSVVGPTAQGYNTPPRLGPSPPASPLLPPAGPGNDGSYHVHGHRPSYAGASTSSLNLNAPPQGRAPSAYLEDLFDGHAPPHSEQHR